MCIMDIIAMPIIVVAVNFFSLSIDRNVCNGYTVIEQASRSTRMSLFSLSIWKKLK